MSKVTLDNNQSTNEISNKDIVEKEKRNRKDKNNIPEPVENVENGIIIIEDQDIKLPDKIRSEVNFLVYPIFRLEKKSDDQGVIEITMTVERNNQKLEVFWGVYSHPYFGIPGPFDKKVFDAIQEIIESLPRPIQNPIPIGSLYSLCKRIGIYKDSGKSYKMIEDSLKRLTLISIDSKETFYDKGKRTWIRDTFHLYDRIVWAGEELPDGTIADTNYIFLNSKYLDNINNGYVKPIDYEFYRGLRSDISKRLYELLGVKFYPIFQRNLNIKSIRYLYDTLCDLIPVKKQKYLSRIRQQFENAILELQEKGFLEKCEIKKENSKILLYFYPGQRAKDEFDRFKNEVEPYEEPQFPEEAKQIAPPETQPNIEPQPEALVRYFYKKNFNRDISEVKLKEIDQAERLLTKYDEKLAYFIVDYAIESAKKTNFNMKAFGAVLQYEAEAVEKYEMMRKLKQKEEEDRRRKEEEEKLRDEERRKAEELAKKIDEILNTLPEKELEEIRREALARAKERSQIFIKEGKPIPELIISLCIREIIKERYLKD